MPPTEVAESPDYTYKDPSLDLSKHPQNDSGIASALNTYCAEVEV